MFDYKESHKVIAEEKYMVLTFFFIKTVQAVNLLKLSTCLLPVADLVRLEKHLLKTTAVIVVRKIIL